MSLDHGVFAIETSFQNKRLRFTGFARPDRLQGERVGSRANVARDDGDGQSRDTLHQIDCAHRRLKARRKGNESVSDLTTGITEASSSTANLIDVFLDLTQMNRTQEHESDLVFKFLATMVR